MELNELMKDCLIQTHGDYPDLDWVDTVIQAFAVYVNLTGGPVEFVDDEEAEEYFNKCIGFLVDCVLVELIQKGLVEVAGMEDGEFVYQTSAVF